MRLRILFGLIFLSISGMSHAAVMNPILGLDIGGTLYNVTFHDQPGDSFNALWDADDDGVFGGGTSLFSSAPTFWGDEAGAIAAANAIIAALGSTHTTVSNMADSFFIPWGGQAGDTTLAAGRNGISIAFDQDSSLAGENLMSTQSLIYDDADFFTHKAPYASFALVPVPAAVWLFASALLGFVGISRRKPQA